MIVHSFLLGTKMHHLDMILFCSNMNRSYLFMVLLHCHIWRVTDSLSFVYILPSESPNGILFIKRYFQIKITNNLQCVQYNTRIMEHSGLYMSYASQIHTGSHWRTRGDIADSQECSEIFQCYVMRHAMLLVLVMMSLYGLLKCKCSKPQGSTENDAKSNFLRNIYSEQVLITYSQGAQEIHLNCISLKCRQD